MARTEIRFQRIDPPLMSGLMNKIESARERLTRTTHVQITALGNHIIVEDTPRSAGNPNAVSSVANELREAMIKVGFVLT